MAEMIAEGQTGPELATWGIHRRPAWVASCGCGWEGETFAFPADDMAGKALAQAELALHRWQAHRLVMTWWPENVPTEPGETVTKRKETP